MPSRPAARHTSDRSPDGSAAASQQQPPGLRGQRVQLPPEALLDPARQRHRAGQPEPARQLRRASAPRGSSSSASGLPCVSATIRSRTRASSGPASAESSSARASSSRRPPRRQLRQPGQLRRPGPGPRTPARPGRPASRRATNPRACADALVQPLLVIDQADQRPLPGHLRQQAQHRQPDQEPVRRRPGAQAERGPQRIPLRHRQALQRGPASARTADAARRRPAPSPTARPPPAPPGSLAQPAGPGSPAARSCPRPGRRRTTRARLSPAWTASTSRSSTPHSARRPVSPAARSRAEKPAATSTAPTLYRAPGQRTSRSGQPLADTTTARAYRSL